MLRSKGGGGGGGSSVVEHSTADREVPGSIPGAPSYFILAGQKQFSFNNSRD